MEIEKMHIRLYAALFSSRKKWNKQDYMQDVWWAYCGHFPARTQYYTVNHFIFV